MQIALEAFFDPEFYISRHDHETYALLGLKVTEFGIRSNIAHENLV